MHHVAPACLISLTGKQVVSLNMDWYETSCANGPITPDEFIHSLKTDPLRTPALLPGGAADIRSMKARRDSLPTVSGFHSSPRLPVCQHVQNENALTSLQGFSTRSRRGPKAISRAGSVRRGVCRISLSGSGGLCPSVIPAIICLCISCWNAWIIFVGP